MSHAIVLEHGALWWCGLAGLGLSVGVIAGMFGVGGGFLMTPLLALGFGVPLPVAVGTGLCQMIGVATAALLRHARLSQGEFKMDVLMLVPSLLGVGLGERTVTALASYGQVTLAPGHPPVSAAKLAVLCAYVVLLGSVAVWMLRDAAARPAATAPPRPGPLTRVPLPPFTCLPRTGVRVSVFLVAYLGLALGFLSGLLGIGGGVALMPILVYGIGMPIRTAAGTGILVLLATSLVGTLAHARAGHVHLGMAVILLVGSTLGAQIGATLTARLDGRRLRGLFALLVAATAIAVAADVLRSVFG